ncbi:MAG: glycosyltransferase [Bacteroidales bacterium]|nr:glycosyltransferase [Bacteroidales bacterium]
MKLSVVTIVFNDVIHIEKTINSVLSQTYDKIEYIIIDGASNDGTVDIIKKYDDKLDFWNSEPDKGLYDAMNKGLQKTSGDYICFLNSGDLFFDETTVEKMFASAENKQVDIFYGETVIIDEQGEIKGKRRLSAPEKLDWKSFKNGMLVSHQAFIPARKLAPNYNLKYKFSSDFDWCVRIMKNAENIQNTNQTIIRYLDGGLTKKRLIKSLRERFRIMSKYYGFLTTSFIHVRNGLKFSWFVLRKKWF